MTHPLYNPTNQPFGPVLFIAQVLLLNGESYSTSRLSYARIHLRSPTTTFFGRLEFEFEFEFCVSSTFGHWKLPLKKKNVGTSTPMESWQQKILWGFKLLELKCLTFLEALIFFVCSVLTYFFLPISLDPLYPLPLTEFDWIEGLFDLKGLPDSHDLWFDPIFWNLLNHKLVGGWTNPSEKYARQIGNLPQGSGWT